MREAEIAIVREREGGREESLSLYSSLLFATKCPWEIRTLFYRNCLWRHLPQQQQQQQPQQQQQQQHCRLVVNGSTKESLARASSQPRDPPHPSPHATTWLTYLPPSFACGWLLHWLIATQQLLQLPHTKIRISNSPLSWLCLLHAQNWTAAAVADAVESSRVRASQFARVKCKRCCCCCCLQHLTVKAHSRTAFKWWLPPSLCAVCQITLELNDWIQFAIENTPPTKTETRLDLTQVIWS